MFGLGGGELLLVAFMALIFIGPKKLPELARGLGKGIREFQKAKDDLVDEVQSQNEATPEIKEPSQTKGPPS
ncbi:twin-arginine translocase TatA/TatE family subunit [Bacteriovoracales bacterium]|nr:twin-arginine translocase TatA/TatE family subunit [Bacteriovoracales bacterium]